VSARDSRGGHLNRHDIPKKAAPTGGTPARAFATLVTNEEYGRGALALVRSLKWTGTSVPVLVLATGEAEHLDELEKEGCRIVPVQQPQVSDAFKRRHSREALHRAAPFNKGNKPAFHDPVDNFCKLELWRLTDYDKIVFLDADSLVVKPIDMLFGFPEFSGAPILY
jgi:alpha-N-acetylglucosamine transferase